MGIAMNYFQGRLRGGDLTVFERVIGQLEPQEGDEPASGSFEIHEGGILGNGLPDDRPYRLELNDGREWLIRPTMVHASNSAGIARVEFRMASAFIAGDEGPGAALG